jgi:accessory gene regulator B
MKNICAVLSNNLSERGVIDKSNEDIYAYGIEVMISTAADVLLTLAIGILLNSLLKTVCFFFILSCVRKFTGGYHAKTYFWCKSIYVATIFFVHYMSNFLEKVVSPFIITSAFMGFIAIIAVFAPVKNENKHLTKSQRKNSRILAVLATLIGLIICLVCSVRIVWLSSLILASWGVITVMMLPPAIINKKIKNKEISQNG